MPSFSLPSDYARIRRVNSFQELVSTPFADGVNALCWPRTMSGDFGEVVAQLGVGEGEGITTLDEARLLSLNVSPAGRAAIDQMLEDQRLLRVHDLDPVLNCISGYPRDEEPGPVPTDVFSFHADSAPVEAATWLCTYHGPASEGRKVDIPETRAELLKLYGGADDADFSDWLHENCYDLHYAPRDASKTLSESNGLYAFGVGHLWRIAIDWPGSPVPPCIHRAPATVPDEPPRLLLIS